MSENVPAAPAGWYQDPQNPGVRRWWDGAAWSPEPSTPPKPPAKGSTSRIVWGVILLAFALLQSFNVLRLVLIGDSAAVGVGVIVIVCAVFGVLHLVKGLDRRSA